MMRHDLPNDGEFDRLEQTWADPKGVATAGSRMSITSPSAVGTWSPPSDSS